MDVHIIHKIPNGKLVRMNIQYDTATLQDIRINGDFFIHPEETIGEMENALINLPVEALPTRITQLLDRVTIRKKAQLIGIDNATLAQLIHEAIRQ